jgi:hypothetical protein
MRFKRLFSVTAMLLAAAVPVTLAQPHLVVARSLTLTGSLDSFDGRLDLLEDARLTPELKKTLWESGGPEMAFDPKDPVYKDLTSIPLRKAVLRLLDERGKVIAKKTLEREMARMRFEALRPGRRTILVTTDLSAGFGSYSGPDTELLEVIGDRLGRSWRRMPNLAQMSRSDWRVRSKRNGSWFPRSAARTVRRTSWSLPAARLIGGQ